MPPLPEIFFSPKKFFWPYLPITLCHSMKRYPLKRFAMKLLSVIITTPELLQPYARLLSKKQVRISGWKRFLPSIIQTQLHTWWPKVLPSPLLSKTQAYTQQMLKSSKLQILAFFTPSIWYGKTTPSCHRQSTNSANLFSATVPYVRPIFTLHFRQFIHTTSDELCYNKGIL